MTAAAKVLAARTALVLDEPFFGALALRLVIVEDPTCPTAWVDGVRLGYNPAYIDTLTHAEVLAVLVHEVMHCACGHPWRRAGRDPKQWNVACDYAINPEVEAGGYTLPGGVLLDPQYSGHPSEWIFARLPQPEPEPDGQDGQSGQDGQDGQDAGTSAGQDGQDAGQDGQSGQDAGQDGQDGQDAGQSGQDGQSGGKDAPPDPAGEVRDAPAEAEATENTEADWSRAVQESARAAEARGNLPGHLERFAKEAAAPRVDWRSALWRFVQQAARADFTWTRPNPRYAAAGLYLPSLAANELGALAVAIDTSGSVDDVLLGQCERELSAIIEDCNPSRVHVIYCDRDVKRVDTIERGEPLELHPVGGGGTDFRPVFRAIDAMDEPPVALVYLTDLAGRFPESAPDYPVLWGHTREPRAVPFGELVPVV